MYINGQDLGWRLRVLRARYGLSIVEVSQRAGLATSYLSRLERNAMEHSKPKPDTIDKVLDALGASASERAAVYHVEEPPISRYEIDAQVREIAALQEDDTEPVELIDDHFHVWYLNRSARAALGLNSEEYSKVIGTNSLLALIDPCNPRYSRVPAQERSTIFSLQSQVFKRVFANQEFDAWYRYIERAIRMVPWASGLWDLPEPSEEPLVLERQDITILNPVTGHLQFRSQLNHLTANPRFLLADWSYLNTVTAIQLAILRTRPEFSYTYQAGLQTTAPRLTEYSPLSLY